MVNDWCRHRSLYKQQSPTFASRQNAKLPFQIESWVMWKCIIIRHTGNSLVTFPWNFLLNIQTKQNWIIFHQYTKNVQRRAGVNRCFPKQTVDDKDLSSIEVHEHAEYSERSSLENTLYPECLLPKFYAKFHISFVL